MVKDGIVLLVVLALLSTKSAFAESVGEESHLRVVTYNHALLNFMNPIKSVYVPMKNSRSKAIPKVWTAFLREQKPDVVFLQEVWYREDYELLGKVFELQDYRPVVAAKQVPTYNRRFGVRGHGLQIFVREEKLELVSSEFIPYLDHSGTMIRGAFEDFKALKYKVDVQRGTLTARVRLKGRPGSTKVRLVTTHLTSRLEEREVRDAQLAALSKTLVAFAGNADSVILGADLNISPSFLGEKPEELTGYLSNSQQYLKFMCETGMADSFVTAKKRLGKRFTQDRTQNSLARRGPSTKDEPEQRLDFIMLNGAVTQLYRTVFTENSVSVRRRKFGHKIPLSDHFGVMVDCKLRSPLAELIQRAPVGS